MDVSKLMSWVDSFVDTKYVSVRVSINELDLVPNRIVAGLEGVLRNGGLKTSGYGRVVYPCHVAASFPVAL